MKCKPDLSRFAPPGMNIQQELKLFLWGYGASVVFSLRFLWRYGFAYYQLYGYENNVYGLLSYVSMDDFVWLIEDVFDLFPILGICLVLWAVLHYAYHWQGSRSIYLMRRLPSRWELHRRCLALPAAGAVICILTVTVLFFLFYALYMLATPAAVLKPGQWDLIWSVIFA